MPTITKGVYIRFLSPPPPGINEKTNGGPREGANMNTRRASLTQSPMPHYVHNCTVARIFASVMLAIITVQL
jgi:hypothetical protein